ncbi:putative nuclease HARBI1 [Aphis gossypii]|uniref:putative nuclease HARBI1 n=1 Tax=Aphis gossypii TaxID=80765 RepID=UPI002158C465|nr:putative nuclease HARBI1 [Aphis gossypii]
MDDYLDMDYMDDNYDFLNGLGRARKTYKRNNYINIDPIKFYSDSEFCRRFRLTKHVFLNILMPMIFTEQERRIHTDLRGLPVNKMWKVLIALRFYATGCYQLVNGDMFELSQSTISRIIKDVSLRIAKNLRTWVKFPLPNQVEIIQQKFYQISKFPGVTMAMDCTHIPISSPGGEQAEYFRNRKGWMSFNVQLIVGPDMEIFDVVARWPGSVHDSRIFQNSRALELMENG